MFSEYFMQAAQSILTLLVLFAVWAALKFFIYHVDEAKRKIIIDIVREGVMFAQEKYGYLIGSDRYKFALARISKAISERKILFWQFRVSEEQLDTLIHAILKALKAEFGDDWWLQSGKVVPEEAEPAA